MQTVSEECRRIIVQRVIGIGGGGIRIVNAMRRNNTMKIDYVGIDTDIKSLKESHIKKKLQIGSLLTNGMGTRANISTGRKAVLEDYSRIKGMLSGADRVFLIACMGGGTGTGSLPLIAKVAQEKVPQVTCLVTKPYNFEGVKRTMASDVGIAQLQKTGTAYFVLPLELTFALQRRKRTLMENYKIADEILAQTIASLISVTSLY